MKIGIAGASGYAGGELLRYLISHPEFKIEVISAGSNAGEPITSIHPHLSHYAGRKFDGLDIQALNNCDLIFLALPHGESAKVVSQIKDSVKIVDLGADFRLEDSNSWSKYYGGEHAGTWVYGLPEKKGQRDLIANQKRIANPGCYATVISLAILPMLEFIDTEDVVVVAASGTTGAGRSAKINLIGSEVMNSLSSYKFAGAHQHTPEIEEITKSKISFTPILAPMPRGILATVTAKIKSAPKDIHATFVDYYQNEEFVWVLPQGQMPKTSSVIGSNFIQLQVAVDSHTNRIVVSAVIDNLGKGAASQAIQNANLICGLPENLAIAEIGLGS